MDIRRALFLFIAVAIALPTQAQYVPPANCTAWFDGCNTCVRVGTEGGACTRKACIDEQQPGYCTAYASQNGDQQAPAQDRPEQTQTEATPTESAESVVSPEEAPQGGVIALLWRLWDIFRSWLIF